MRTFAPATVIAVDVEDKDNSAVQVCFACRVLRCGVLVRLSADAQGVDNYGDSLSGWWLLWKLCLSFFKLSKPVKIPRLSEVNLQVRGRVRVPAGGLQSRCVQVAYIAHNMQLNALLRAGRNDDSIVYVRPDVQRFKFLGAFWRRFWCCFGGVSARAGSRAWGGGALTAPNRRLRST